MGRFSFLLRTVYVSLVIGTVGVGMSSFSSHSETITAKGLRKFVPVEHAHSRIAYYPFIHYEENLLSNTQKQQNLASFFSKLDDLIFQGTGNVNIVHIGGSHVQDGTMTNRMRENFSNLSPNIQNGFGFVFPHKLAQSNGPQNIKCSFEGEWRVQRNSHNKHNASWGISGYTAETADRLASLKIWIEDSSVLSNWNSLTLFHPANQAPLRILSEDSLVKSKSADLNYSTYEFWKQQDTLELVASNSDKQLFQGILFGNNSPGLTYHAVGVNGASVKSFLRNKDFTSQMTKLTPDLVIFGLGINDAYLTEAQFDPELFKLRYDSLLSECVTANPNCNFLFLTNNDSYYKRRYANKNALKVRKCMMELAEKHNAVVWDLFGIMGGLNSINQWHEASLAKDDRLHFTSEGYILVADLLFEAIKTSYGDHLDNSN